jgi:hypothetical protein
MIPKISSSVSFCYFLGRAYERKGKVDKAIKIYEEGLRIYEGLDVVTFDPSVDRMQLAVRNLRNSTKPLGETKVPKATSGLKSWISRVRSASVKADALSGPDPRLPQTRLVATETIQTLFTEHIILSAQRETSEPAGFPVMRIPWRSKTQPGSLLVAIHDFLPSRADFFNPNGTRPMPLLRGNVVLVTSVLATRWPLAIGHHVGKFSQIPKEVLEILDRNLRELGEKTSPPNLTFTLPGEPSSIYLTSFVPYVDVTPFRANKLIIRLSNGPRTECALFLS